MFPLAGFPGPGVPIKQRQQKRAFTAEEDSRLTELVTTLGDRAWGDVEKQMPGRSCRQCRERWNLYLCPSISNDAWTPEEDVQLIQLFQACGPKWTVIASHFPKRTANNVKNREKQLQRRSQRLARLAPAQIPGLAPRPAPHEPPDKGGIVVPVTQDGAL
jgi:hypothetical protein